MARPLVLIAVGLLAFGSLSKFLWHVHRGRQLVTATKKYERIQSGGQQILIAGDSIGLGIGATSPETSIAGLCGRDFPTASVKNISISGAETDGLLQQVQSVTGQRFDLIIIIIGANDIIHFSDLHTSLKKLDQVLKLAQAVSRQVILMPEGNMGNPPLFPRMASTFITPRSRQFRTGAMALARQYHIAYVDVFRERLVDPWRKDSHRFYASDLFHPADAGYLDWYQAIRATIQLPL